MLGKLAPGAAALVLVATACSADAGPDEEGARRRDPAAEWPTAGGDYANPRARPRGAVASCYPHSTLREPVTATAPGGARAQAATVTFDS